MTTDELLKTLGWSEDLLKAHRQTGTDVDDPVDFDSVLEPEIIASSELVVQFESSVLTTGKEIIFQGVA